MNSVYGEEENKFLYNNVVVGRKAKGRFKLSNTQKVPCDVTLSIRPVTAKVSSKTVECFDIEPPLKLQIPAHSHTYATVLFTPQGNQETIIGNQSQISVQLKKSRSFLTHNSKRKIKRSFKTAVDICFKDSEGSCFEQKLLYRFAIYPFDVSCIFRNVIKHIVLFYYSYAALQRTIRGFY